MSGQNEKLARQALAALAISIKHTQIIAHEFARDGRAVHLIWHAGGNGDVDHWFEVRKSSDLLLKTGNARSAADRFIDEVLA